MRSADSCANLIALFDNEKWQHWSPRKDISPCFDRIKSDAGDQLAITSNGNFNNYGKWFCEICDIEDGSEYEFSVEYLPRNIDSELVSIYAMLTWSGKKGELIRREYAENILELEDGWRRLYTTVRAPADAILLKIELAFKWSVNGAVYWRNPILLKTGRDEIRRIVKVATTNIKTRKNLKDNLDAMLDHIDKAGEAGADIICLTETFYGSFVFDISPYEISQPIPGELTNIISEKAKKYGAYIILSMFEKDGIDLYNTAVLIDRKGEIAGKYRKVHLPLAEVEDGITPGNEYKVFDTDFGRIGILICWDQAFPEAAREVALKGAEIIFIPTAGEDEIQQKARARDNGVYVVVSGQYGPKSSRIIDTYGEIIATVESQNPGKDEGVCVAELDLEKKFYSYWLSLGPCYSESRSVYRKERRIDTYRRK